MAENTPVTVHRNERVLAFMLASCLGLSILAIIALFIGRGAGAVMSGGVWPVIAVLPLIGLPIGFVLIIVLLVVYTLRRGRGSRDAE